MADPLSTPAARRADPRRLAAILLLAAGLMLPGAAFGSALRPPPGGVLSRAASSIAGEGHGRRAALPERRVEDGGPVLGDDARGSRPEQASWALLALASLLLAALVWQVEAARARAAAARQSIVMPPSTTWTEPVT
jgi:hypothetical protein